MTVILPQDIEKALEKCPTEYVTMHNMNAEHPMVKGCVRGTVFNFGGDMLIYVGVNGRNRKYPCIGYSVEKRDFLKCTTKAFDKVRAVS
tara:strand:- start:2750 stop:3016 length:267 start_codon:yes stop_codon:yes gene_type:complete